MNKGVLIGAVGIACLILAGCAAGQCTVAKGPKFDPSANASYMILPFGDTNENCYRLQYQNAASLVRDAFETAFLEQGFKIKPCPEARTSEAISGVKGTMTADYTKENAKDSAEKQQLAVESQVRVGEQGITEEHGLEAGKLGGADVVLFGTVTAFYRGVFGGRYTTVGFSVKAIDVKTGEVVWKASLMRSTRWTYNYDPGMYAQEIAKRLVSELVGKP
jgi:hypothetical protein